jgi:hypothetical protein
MESKVLGSPSVKEAYLYRSELELELPRRRMAVAVHPRRRKIWLACRIRHGVSDPWKSVVAVPAGTYVA